MGGPEDRHTEAKSGCGALMETCTDSEGPWVMRIGSDGLAQPLGLANTP